MTLIHKPFARIPVRKFLQVFVLLQIQKLLDQALATGEAVRDSSLGPGRVSLCRKPPYVSPRHPLATFGCLAYQRREELRIVETPAHTEERSAANGIAESGHQADEQ